jgi:polyisoprenoid-binding protein YceI
MKRLGVIVSLLSLLMLVAACNDPAANVNKAVTSEAQKAASPQTAATGQKYGITAQNSKIEFIGSKVTGSHNGSFERFNGEIHYVNDPAQSHVQITIDAASVKADDPKLTEHLKTPDFFDVAKHPEAKFESTAIKAGGEKGATHTVTGNLTLHGVTKSITFPATISVTADVATVDANFAINRKDFGINYAGAADNLIRDDVVMTLRIRANKAS